MNVLYNRHWRDPYSTADILRIWSPERRLLKLGAVRNLTGLIHDQLEFINRAERRSWGKAALREITIRVALTLRGRCRV